jgi:hypothetical protein
VHIDLDYLLRPQSHASDVSRYGPVNFPFVALKEHLTLQRYLAHLALETVPLFDVSQMLPLEVLRQVVRLYHIGS